MKELVFMFCVAIGLTSCQTKTHSKAASVDHEMIIDTTLAKTWLIEQIKYYFDADRPNMENITTTEYSTFKNEAMNVDLHIDGSLTNEEFIEKYNNKYDLATHPTQIGFLISGQDWGKIHIEKCVFESFGKKDNTAVFKTTLNDTIFKVDYNRDIVVIFQNGKFLIDDVYEYD